MQLLMQLYFYVELHDTDHKKGPDTTKQQWMMGAFIAHSNLFHFANHRRTVSVRPSVTLLIYGLAQ